MAANAMPVDIHCFTRGAARAIHFILAYVKRIAFDRIATDERHRADKSAPCYGLPICAITLTLGRSQRRATATSVMTELYWKMKDQPYAPDLNALRIDLGIQINHGIVSFNDTARLSAVRRAITHTPADHATL
jgi:hypothetical protein